MRQAILGLGVGRRRGNHPGLLLQRYLFRHADAGERRALLDAARQAARGASLRAVYFEAFARWDRSFARGRPCRSQTLTTSARLIVGLGSENILETGLRLHHTYGTPIIPGSALKGLASHYCHDAWGQRRDAAAPEENRSFQRGGNHHSLIFGNTEDGGVIAFHDAWIIPASLTEDALCLDVMTPHHPKWQLNEAPPTDLDSPVPVSFLSVAGTFDVRLSWSGPADIIPVRAESWLDLAMTLLREALAEWGIGGKTGSGYGRLVSSPAAVAPPQPGERVVVQLLEERTRRGGWRAGHAPSGLAGPIQNSGAVPPDKKAGQVLELIVASVTERGIDFRYPTPADEARAGRTPSGGRRNPGRNGRCK